MKEIHPERWDIGTLKFNLKKIQDEIKKREMVDQDLEITKELVEDMIKKYNINAKDEDKIRRRLNFDKGYLTKDELMEINAWKVTNNRTGYLIEENEDGIIEKYTKKALSAGNDISTLEALIKIRGVSNPVASAILMFYDPSRYGVYDQRASKTLLRYGITDQRLKNNSTGDCAKYFSILRQLAKKYNLTARQMDKVLFQLDAITGNVLDF